jgi:hypothetical protein
VLEGAAVSALGEIVPEIHLGEIATPNCDDDDDTPVATWKAG